MRIKRKTKLNKKFSVYKQYKLQNKKMCLLLTIIIFIPFKIIKFNPNNEIIYNKKSNINTNINAKKSVYISDLDFNRNNNTIIVINSFQAKIEKGRKFLDKCLEGILLNNNDSLEINSDPIISIIIPIYKCEKTMISTIRSVQNQNF